MLSVLQQIIELDLAGLLAQRDRWNSVHVTYHPPRVERLWVQHGDFRVFLHRIYPCEFDDALFHPHPWPSAVKVVSGRYEHLLSVGAHGPRARMILEQGSMYELTDPALWHSVRPLEGSSDSIMVVGSLYDPPVEMPSPPTAKQTALSVERFEALLTMWQDRINPPVECHTCGWKGRHKDLASYEGEVPHARCPQCFDEDQVFR